MKRVLPFLATTLAVCLAQAQEVATSPSSVDYEELPELKASEILKPEFLKGPHYTVREPVPTTSGANQYAIDSDYGVFEADGNEMLLQRIKEIYLIAKLKDVSRTDQFKESLVTAAKAPLNAAKNVVKDPVNAVSSASKGLMKFMGRTAQTVKNVSKGQAQKVSTDDALGYNKTKKKVAVSLGVDPYTTNSVLQKELDDIAWASWAGGFTFSAATFPISGPVGAALTMTNVSSAIGEMLAKKSPAELKAINRSTLRAMGTSAKDTERFLSNTAFTPTYQTQFVFNLKSLSGVENRGAFVGAAAEVSSNDSDALFCVETSALMSQLHKGDHPLARIAMIENLPICIAKDGTVIVALQWDYAAWTPMAERFVESLQAQNAPNSSYLAFLSGVVSPRLRQELESRHFRVEDRVASGPLK